MSLCPNVDDISFGHLVKGVSARFICCRVTIFHFVINKQLWGDTLKVYTYSILHNFTISFSIY